MNIELLNSVETSLIEELRELVRNYAYQHPDEIDLMDVQNRIRFPDENGNHEASPCGKVPDLMLRRLLLAANPPLQPESALKFFIETFKFRTQYKLSQMSLTQIIPIEFFKFCILIPDGVDRVGNKLFIVRIKYYRKIPQFDVLIKHGLLRLIEQYDRQIEKSEFDSATLVVDLQDFDYIANYNIDLVRFCVNIFFKYRFIILRVLVHKLPRIFNWLFRLVVSWINAVKKVQHQVIFIVDESNIDQFIAADQRPAFLYGTRPLHPDVPHDAVPFKILAQSFIEKGLIEAKNVELIGNYVQELINKQEE